MHKIVLIAAFSGEVTCVPFGLCPDVSGKGTSE